MTTKGDNKTDQLLLSLAVLLEVPREEVGAELLDYVVSDVTELRVKYEVGAELSGGAATTTDTNAAAAAVTGAASSAAFVASAAGSAAAAAGSGARFEACLFCARLTMVDIFTRCWRRLNGLQV